MRRGQVRRFHRNEPAQKGEDRAQDAGNHCRRNTRQPGSHFRSFNVIYNLECDTIEEQSIVGRAVTQAQEKYCGTVDMLRKIAPVAHEISIVSTETMKV